MKKFFYDKRIVFVYIITILIILIGTSYALSTASSSLGLTTALIGIDGDAYGSPTFDSSNLDFKPILDTKVEESTDNVIKIDFTVGGAESNNNDNIIYDIALNGLDINCNLLSPYIKWKLLKEGTEVSSGSLDYKFDTIDEDGRLVLTTIQEDLPDYNENDKSTYDDYTFYMWFSDSCQSEDISTCKSAVDQSNLIGQNIEGKIEVELYTEGKKQLVRNPENVLSSSKCTGAYIATLNTNGGVLASGVESSIKVISGSNWDPTSLPEPSRTDTVIFNTNGGSDITTVSNVINNFEIENTINTFSNIPKIKLMENSNNLIEISYDFVGWYLDKNLTIPVTSDVKVSNKNQKLYAKWSGDNTITLPSVTKAYYDFLGWYSDSSLKNKVGDAGDSYQVIKNTNLYAGWYQRYIQITLNDNGGSGGMGTIYVVPGEGFFSDMELTNPITKVTVPTKIGHTFTGYTGLTDNEGNITVSSDSIIEETTFTAGWSINSYNIKFIANQFNPVNNQTINGITMSYDYTTSYLTLNGTTSNAGITIMTTQMNFTQGEQFITTFDYISGSYTATSWGCVATEIGINTTGLSDRNWSDIGFPTSGSNSVNFIVNESAATEGTNLYNWMYLDGDWTFTNYKIKVTVTKNDEKQLQHNSSIGNLPTPTKTGYTFNGWYTGENGTGTKVTSETLVPANNVTYYAKWTANSYELSIDPNGGYRASDNDTSVIKVTKNYGDTEEISGRVKTGYTLTGYTLKNTLNNSTTDLGGATFTFDSSAKTGTFVQGSVPITLVAQWEANIYTITYNDNGGSGGPITQNFVFNSGAKISTTKPTRTGYTFSHWTYNGNNFAPGAAIPTDWGSFTLTAQWVDNIAPSVPTYTASFANGSGTYTSGAWTNKQVNTTITSTDSGSGISYFQYSKDNKVTWTTLSFSVSSGIQTSGTTASGTETWNLSDGRNDTVYFRACDVAGNCSNASSAYVIKYDTSAPTTTTYAASFANGSGNYTSGTWTNKQVNTKITSTDASSGISYFQYSKDSKATWTNLSLNVSNGISKSGTTATGTESWSVTDGRNDIIYFRACDALNQCGAASSAYNIKYDTSAPTLSVALTNTSTGAAYTSGATPNTVRITPTVGSTGSSGLLKLQYCHDEVSWVDWPPGGTSAWDISWNGFWQFYMRAVDNAGNASASASFYIDKSVYHIYNGAYGTGSFVGRALTLADAVSLVPANGYIYAVKTETDSSTVTINKNVYFHPNGFTITRTGSTTVSAGTFTVTGSGTLTSNTNVAYVNGSGNVTLSGATVSGTGNADTIHAVAGSTGTITVSGSTVTGSSSGYYVIYSAATSGKVNVTGGTVSASYWGISVAGTFTMSGGTVKNTAGSTGTYTLLNLASTATGTITGGNIHASNSGRAVWNSGTLTINGTGVSIYNSNTTQGVGVRVDGSGAMLYLAAGTIQSISSSALHVSNSATAHLNYNSSSGKGLEYANGAYVGCKNKYALYGASSATILMGTLSYNDAAWSPTVITGGSEQYAFYCTSAVTNCDYRGGRLFTYDLFYEHNGNVTEHSDSYAITYKEYSSTQTWDGKISGYGLKYNVRASYD